MSATSTKLMKTPMFREYLANNVLRPVRADGEKYYFQDSEFYHIRGGFVAEVIQNPMMKFIEDGNVGKVIYELQRVTMRAFGKPLDDLEIYAPKSVVQKNAIFVDWLTVVRAGSEVVAYASSSYLDESRSALYFNATIVDSNYQAKGAIGSINHMYVLEKILSERNDYESNSLNLITRTRNKSVAKLMGSVLKEMKISADGALERQDKDYFSFAAKTIGGEYDENEGIHRNVYPPGLPNGVDKTCGDINEIFGKLGECDALMVSGKINYSRICKFLKREVSFPGKIDLKEKPADTIQGQMAA